MWPWAASRVCAYHCECSAGLGMCLCCLRHAPAAVLPALSTAWTSAPAASRARHASSLPYRAARMSGVYPSASRFSSAAPCPASRATAGARPAMDARCRAERPCCMRWSIGARCDAGQGRPHSEVCQSLTRTFCVASKAAPPLSSSTSITCAG